MIIARIFSLVLLWVRDRLLLTTVCARSLRSDRAACGHSSLLRGFTHEQKRGKGNTALS
ncbi:unnamed protein product, partial [Brassica rapa subsp. trilocularis]